MSHPLTRMIRRLDQEIGSATHDDSVMTSGTEQGLPLEPSQFHEVTASGDRRMTFVDGGNGTVASSPAFVASLNRLYCTTFAGQHRIAPPAPRIDFFSLVSRYVHKDEDAYYRAAIFAYREDHKRYLPREEDVAAGMRPGHELDPRMPSLARSLGEWRLARRAVENMQEGDILVMDGSLATPDKIESRYANDVYDEAKSRNVIVCALSKTSSMITRSGEPLLARAYQIGRDTRYGMWRVPVARSVWEHDRGFVMAVKLHPLAGMAFRFDILQEQYDEMDDETINGILGCVASNSGDASFLGYPYGLVDADKLARVRNGDVIMCRGRIDAMVHSSPALSLLGRQLAHWETHDHLNKVAR